MFSLFGGILSVNLGNLLVEPCKGCGHFIVIDVLHVLLHEGQLIWSTLHVDEAEVGGSLSVGIQHGFWVHEDGNTVDLEDDGVQWGSLGLQMLQVLLLEERKLIWATLHVDKSKVCGSLSVGI